MLNYDFSPFYRSTIGFDRLLSLLDKHSVYLVHTLNFLGRTGNKNDTVGSDALSFPWC